MENKTFTLQQYENRQKDIFENKVKHGFNITNPYQEIRYITEELGELMRAFEKGDIDNVAEELADIVIFSYGLAEMSGAGDLDKKIFEKMVINANRKYIKDSNGDFVKVGEDAPVPNVPDIQSVQDTKRETEANNMKLINTENLSKMLKDNKEYTKEEIMQMISEIGTNYDLEKAKKRLSHFAGLVPQHTLEAITEVIFDTDNESIYD